MTFKSQIDGDNLDVDLNSTNLKDVLKYCKPKEQVVLLKKFGLDGKNQRSLQKIGDEYGLTRERIRQIEGQGITRFRRLITSNDRYMDVIESAKKVLLQNGGILAENDLISKMVNKGKYDFTKKEFRLILLSDFEIYHIKRNRRIDRSFYVDPLFERVLTNIAIFTKEFFQDLGEPKDLYAFIDIIKDEFCDKHPKITNFNDNKFYINFFNVVREISVFDGKIGLDSFPEVNPKTVKDKILYILRKVQKPMHYEEIASKSIEWFPDKPAKVSTYHNELVKNRDLFVNMGLGLYGLKEWGIKGGTVKEILIRIFENKQRAIPVKKLTKEVLKEKMVNPTTVTLTLQKHKDIFERVDKGVYKLKDEYEKIKK